MGAGDMVAGGMRRAAHGVRSVFTGAAASSGAEAPAVDPVQTPTDPDPDPETAAGDLPVADSVPGTVGPGSPNAAADSAAADDAAAPGRPDAPTGSDAPAPADAPADSVAAAETSAATSPKHPRTRSTSAKRTGPSSVPSAADRTGGSPASEPTPAATPPSVEWSADELSAFRAALDADILRLTEELKVGESDLADLVADSRDAAGDDQADSGAKTFEREHEMSVNANIREMLDQAQRAIQRLGAGTYGVCERCGGPIAAGRLRAFPRATLCIACKQAEERR